MSENSSQGASYLQQLLERVDAMKPEEFETPALPRTEEASVTVVGTMTDYHKALFTIMMRAVAQNRTAEQKANDLRAQVAKKVGANWLESLKKFVDGGEANTKLLTELEKAKVELLQAHVELETAQHIFWTELRHSFPEAAKRAHMAVFSDWSVAYHEGEERVIEVIIAHGTDLDGILHRGTRRQ